MSEYKRLTERTKHGIAVLDSGERFVLSCGGYATAKALNRLAELEDKIENGMPVEPPCCNKNIKFYSEEIGKCLFDGPPDDCSFDDNENNCTCFEPIKENKKESKI